MFHSHLIKMALACIGTLLTPPSSLTAKKTIFIFILELLNNGAPGVEPYFNINDSFARKKNHGAMGALPSRGGRAVGNPLLLPQQRRQVQLLPPCLRPYQCALPHWQTLMTPRQLNPRLNLIPSHIQPPQWLKQTFRPHPHFQNRQNPILSLQHPPKHVLDLISELQTPNLKSGATLLL